MSEPSEGRPYEMEGVSLARVYGYLDALRESAETNMLGAGPHLQKRFGLSKQAARSILTAWMEDFS